MAFATTDGNLPMPVDNGHIIRSTSIYMCDKKGEECGIAIPKMERFEKFGKVPSGRVLGTALHARGLKLWDTLLGK